MVRIFLFGSAVAGLLFVTLGYAIFDGQLVADKPSASPSASAGASPGASAGASPGASASTSASVQPGPSASGTGATVTIANLAFGPDLKVPVGTPVTFVNNDTVLHTATNGTNGTPASGSLFDLQLPVGATGSYTFTAAGTYAVTCTVHPAMNMTITVQ